MGYFTINQIGIQINFHQQKYIHTVKYYMTFKPNKCCQHHWLTLVNLIIFMLNGKDPDIKEHTACDPNTWNSEQRKAIYIEEEPEADSKRIGKVEWLHRMMMKVICILTRVFLTWVRTCAKVPWSNHLISTHLQGMEAGESWV